MFEKIKRKFTEKNYGFNTCGTTVMILPKDRNLGQIFV